MTTQIRKQARNECKAPGNGGEIGDGPSPGFQCKIEIANRAKIITGLSMYFSQGSWPSFVCQGTTYDLSHLDEFQITVVDSGNVSRKISVTFSDHCFTREGTASDDELWLYRRSTRRRGVFCVERYRYSLGLADHIRRAATGKVWHLGHDGYASVPTVDHEGVRTLYGIIFGLDPVTGLPVDLHMRIKSAHPRDERELVTFGMIKFSHLVALRMQHKTPNRIMNARRKRPRLQ